MTLLTLAVKNVRHQARNYAGFFLSSAFAVWLFFLYGALLAHPQFQRDNVGDIIRQLMIFVEVVVALFSVMFILYSHSAFLKARKKELGLMTLLGLLPRQIAGIVHYENLLMGFGAITVGVGLGTISTKLFFLGIGQVLSLREPIRFHFSPWVAFGTYGIFLLIFGVISLVSLFRLRRTSVAELIRGAAKPMAPPAFSAWRVGVCVISLGVGYYTALFDNHDESKLFVVMIALIVGTYFFLTQSSVALLGLLKGSRGIYYRHTNLLVVAQLIYKMRDNARILFMVSVLNSIVLATVGLFYHTYSRSGDQALAADPIGMMVIGEPAGVGPGRTAEVLSQHGVGVRKQAHLQALQVKLTPARGGWGDEAVLVSRTAFNQWLELHPRAMAPVEVMDGRAVPVASFVDRVFQGESAATVRLGEAKLALPLDHGVPFQVFNAHPLSLVTLVVADRTYADLWSAYGGAHGVMLHGYALTNWRSSGPAVEQLMNEMGLALPVIRAQRLPGAVTTTIETFNDVQQGYSYMLFLAVFVGLLFFLASGNMLYFKLFTDLYDDRKQYQMLHKVGIRPAEIQRVVTIQTLILFFVPVVVAAAQAAVVLHMMSVWLQSNIWPAVWVVTGVYSVLYGLYFLVTKRTYTRALLSAH